jgi:biopolymer transport protein ExbD
VSYEAGTAFLQIVPSLRGVEAAIRDELRRVAADVDASLGNAAGDSLRKAIKKQTENANKDTDRTAGLFADSLRKRLAAASKALPDLDLSVDTGDAAAEIAAIKADLDDIRKEHINLDLDDDTALAAVEILHERIRALRRDAEDIPVHANLHGAEQELGSVLDFGRQRTELLKREAEQAGGESGRAYGGAFAEQVRDRLGKAVTALPDIEINADSSDADRKLAAIRQRLEELHGRTIGVDIDEGDAIAQLRFLQAALQQLAHDDPSIQVRADTAVAFAELATLLELVKKLDGRRIDLNVVTGGDGVAKLGQDLEAPIERMGALVSLGASLGPAIAPAAAAAAIGIGGIGTAAAASLSGIGVLLLGLYGVVDAVKALSKFQDDSAKSAKSLSAANNTLANSAAQVRSAERSLASARENAAYAAERNARAVVRAQRDVTDAQKAATKAQLEYVEAQQKAREADEDRTISLKENALQQRQANLDIAEAKQKLDDMIANPRATDAEREQAKVNYEERLLQLSKLTIEQRRLQAEQSKSVAVGIAGNKDVAAAQERVESTTRAVADAQQKVTETVEDGKRQQQQAAQQIIGAQESLASAHRAAGQAIVAAGVAGGESLDNLQTAMQNLSPTGRRFAQFIFSLKDEFFELRNAASDPLLDKLQEAITNLLPYLPRVEDFVSGIASELGDLAVEAVDALGNPVWQDFFGFLGKSGVPTLDTLATASGNVASGLVSLLLALSPFNKSMGKGLVEMTADFAHWAAELKNSDGYREFLAYVAKEGPEVVDLIEDLVEVLIRIVIAAAPVGAVVVKVIDAIARAINSLPIGALTILIGIFATVGAVVLPLAGIIRTIEFVMKVASGTTSLWSNGLKLFTGTMGLFRRAVDDGAAAVARFTAAQESASASGGSLLRGSGQFSKGLGVVEGSAEKAGGKLAGLTSKASGFLSFIGGPWGLILGLGSVVLGAFADETAHAEQEMNDLNNGAKEYARILKDGVTPESAKSAAELLKNNAALAGLVKTTRDAGISQHTLVDAINGNADARGRVVDSLNKQIDAEKLAASEARGSSDSDTVASRAHRKRAEELERMRDSLKSSSASTADAIELTDELTGANESAADAITNVRDTVTKAGGSVSDYASGIASLTNVVAYGGQKAQLFAAYSERVGDAMFDAADKTKLFGQILDGIGSAANLYDDTFKGLEVVFTNIAESSISAADKVSLLNRSMKQMYGTVIDQIEAHENLVRTQADLTVQLANNGAGFDLNSAKSAANRQAILANRDALEQALLAARDQYAQDVANGMAMDAAKEKHDKLVTSILSGIPPTQRNTTAVKELKTAYGEVPAAVHTDVTAPGLGEAIDKLIVSHATQMALDMNPPGDKNFILSEIDYLHKTIMGRTGQSAMFKAAGGLIPGTSPTPTADDKLAWLTAGEWVHPVSAVDYYGHETMAAINDRAIPRELFDGYASGGLVSTWPIEINTSGLVYPVDLKDLQRQLAEKMALAESGGLGQAAGAIGALTGVGGYKWQESILRQAFPNIKFFSDYRPGAITVTGNRSYHAVGRAVDMSPRRDVFDWIRANYGSHTKELIFTPAGAAQIKDGKPHIYSQAVAKGHYDHVHWAYDEGGYLPPGLTTVYNGTGKPEPVLTSQQWESVNPANTEPAVSNTYQFSFADTTLTPGRLRAMQDRDAAIARQGRAR